MPERITNTTSIRMIACFAFDDVMSLDVVGPLQVFASANAELERQGRERDYEVLVIADAAGPVPTSGGFRLYADLDWRELELQATDTVLIAGGDGVNRVRERRDILDWLVQVEMCVPRLGSVCSGALILAEAGLLDGRLATTHWSRCDEMRKCFPKVDVIEDRLYSYDAHGLDGDPHIFTSAGVTAGIDLGRVIALAVARRLVMFLKRPGGQAQFSAYLTPAIGTTAQLVGLLEWIPANLDGDLSLEVLANRAGMSARTFSRVFTRDLGMTPARYVERVRVEAARVLLQDDGMTVTRVARLCGFGHPETLRRAFQRHLSVSPQEYADRFGRRPVAVPI